MFPYQEYLFMRKYKSQWQVLIASVRSRSVVVSSLKPNKPFFISGYPLLVFKHTRTQPLPLTSDCSRDLLYGLDLTRHRREPVLQLNCAVMPTAPLGSFRVFGSKFVLSPFRFCSVLLTQPPSTLSSFANPPRPPDWSVDFFDSDYHDGSAGSRMVCWCNQN